MRVNKDRRIRTIHPTFIFGTKVWRKILKKKKERLFKMFDSFILKVIWRNIWAKYLFQMENPLTLNVKHDILVEDGVTLTKTWLQLSSKSLYCDILGKCGCFSNYNEFNMDRYTEVENLGGRGWGVFSSTDIFHACNRQISNLSYCQIQLLYLKHNFSTSSQSF